MTHPWRVMCIPLAVLIPTVPLLTSPAWTASYTFGEDVQISHSTGVVSTNAVGQHLVAARGGKVFVSWADNRSGTWGIYFARSLNGGLTFSPELRVDSPATEAVAGFAMAVDAAGQTVHFAWEAPLPGGPDTGVYYDRSTDGGVSFGIDRLLAVHYQNPIFYVAQPVLAAAPGDRVYVAWYGGWDPGAPAYLMRSEDRGRTFAPPIAIEEMTAGDGFLTDGWENSGLAASTDGRLTMLYGACGPDVLWSDLIVSSDGGSTFAGPGGAVWGFYPSIMYDATGRLHLSATGGYWSIGLWPVHMYSDDGGLTFHGRHDLDGMQGDLQTSVATVWRIVGVLADRRQYNDVALTVSEDGGLTFSPWFRVNDGPVGAYASLAFDETGDAYVTWTDSRTGSPQVWFDRGHAALTVSVNGAGQITGGAGSSMHLRVTPNPSPGEVVFAIVGRVPVEWESLKLDIFDVRGRAVREFDAVRRSVTASTLRWNGTDRDGTPVAPGVYVARLTGGGRSETARFLIAR